jgi:cell division protein FtsQ
MIPRRRKASPASRLRPFWVPFAVVGLLALGTGGFVVAWPGFQPRYVEVTGNHIVPKDEILARAAVASNVNMWLQSPRAMSARIETIPYVAVAHVRRVPPATIAIAVTERIPFALVRSDDRAVLVDRSLRVLQPAVPDSVLPQFALAPDAALDVGRVLTQRSVLAMRDDYDAMIAAHLVPVELRFDRFGGLVATLRGGVAILLGDDANLSEKLSLIDPILAQVDRKGARVATIDLRAPNTPVVVYK